MRSYSTDEKLVAERRCQIAEATVRLLTKKAYNRLTIREIANECGIAPGTIYHYIGSKEDVIDLVAHLDRSLYDGFFQSASLFRQTMNPVEALRQAIDNYYRLTATRQDLILFFYQELKNLPPKLLKKVLTWESSAISTFEQLLIEGCESGHFEIDDTSLVANHIVAEGEMWATRRWFLRKRWTLDEYIAKYTAFFLKAILRSKDSQHPS